MTKQERLKYLMELDERQRDKTELLISELTVSNEEIQDTITHTEQFIEYNRDKKSDSEYLTSDEVEDTI